MDPFGSFFKGTKKIPLIFLQWMPTKVLGIGFLPLFSEGVCVLLICESEKNRDTYNSN